MAAPSSEPDRPPPGAARAASPGPADDLPPGVEVTPLAAGPVNELTGSWPDRRFERIGRPELHSLAVAAPRARALVCPGGGYTRLLLDKEGIEVALWLGRLGIEAHVLVHRLPGADDGAGGRWRKDIALGDGLLALDHLAATGSLPLLLVGLSSGGHLAGVLGCQDHPAAPRGLVAAYAPLNANHRRHKVPPGKPDYPPVEKQDFYDDWPVGLAGHPHALPRVPVFLAFGLQDRSVPVAHALRLIETAAAGGPAVDAHVFAGAPHGFALRDRDGTHAAWTGLAADWIDRLLG